MPPIPCRLALTALLALALHVSASGVDDMTVPDFGQNPTIASVASGDWSSAATWSPARVPVAGDVVEIAAGTIVTFGSASTPAIGVVAIDGTLRYRTDVSTALTVGTMLVREGGTLEIGTAADPIADDATAQLIIADQPIDTGFDPQQFGTGLIAMGTVRMCGHALAPTYARVSTEPLTGATTLTLAEPVSGWRVGDTLLLPDTRHLDWYNHGANYVPQHETLTLAGVSSDGLTLTLSAPLAFDHLGARDPDGTIRFLPHVADATRNLIVSSANPAGVRGHVLFMHRADVDVRYAAFLGLGRTTTDAIDSATFDANGNVTHVGTNQRGRYALHAHHLIGPVSPQGNGYQYTFLGNAVSMGETDGSHKWGITIHDSHYGLVQDNVLWECGGAGLAGELGSESHNVIQHNLATRIYGNGTRVDNDGAAGSGFWFRGPDNIVRDNVASNLLGDAYRYGFIVFATYVGSQTVPAVQGADPTVNGVSVDMNGTPLREFARNEVYGASPEGFSFWWIGAFYRDVHGVAGVMQDCVCWHQNWTGIFLYETNQLTIDGFTVRGDPTNIEGASVGMLAADYMQHQLVITHADIQNDGGGIVCPGVADGTTVIEHSVLANRWNISDSITQSVNGNVLPAKEVIVRDVRFLPLPGRAESDISLNYSSNGNVVQSQQMLVYAFNGNPADNFQVFYAEQLPDFVVPQTQSDGSTIGSPEAGLTNAQNWSTYGIAVAGEIAPADAVARAGIGDLASVIPPEATGGSGGGSSSSTAGVGGSGAGGGNGSRCGLGGGIALIALWLGQRRRSRASRVPRRGPA
jgi:hypothetical protein